MKDNIKLVSRWEHNHDGSDGSKWYLIMFENLNHDPKSGFQKRWGINQRDFRSPSRKMQLIELGVMTEEEYDKLLAEIPKDAAV